MSQVIMGNVVFMIAWVNHNVLECGGKKQHKHMYLFFLCTGPCLLPNYLEPQSITTKLLLPIMPDQHCRIRFYTFVDGTTFVETAVYLIVQSAPTHVNRVAGYC